MFAEMDGAPRAARLLAAVLLGVLDDQSVILVEERHIRREILHEQGADLIVPLPAGYQAEANQQPSGVSIHHE